jgi:hypothetical protein
MEVGVEPKRVAKGLIGEHGGGGEGPGGRGGVELGDQREDEPGDLAEEARIAAKEDPKSFGEGEDKLPVGQSEQQLLVEVLGEQEGPLLAAGGAEVESPAGEWSEVLMVTVRVRTADTGQSLAIVAAGKEAGRDVGDPLDAEVTEVLCVISWLVLRNLADYDKC